MTEYLDTMTSREKDLLATFGSNGCVLDESYERAMVAELEETTKLTSDDMRFLLNNAGKCTAPDVKRNGFKIDADGMYAYVYKEDGTTYLGRTDTTIEIEPGLYILIIKKTGYETQEVAMQVNENEITSTEITLKANTKEEEVPIEEEGEARLTWTGKRKFPTEIKQGEVNWFGIEVTNSGTKTWVGYIGVKLTGENTVEWKFEGDKTKATTVKPNETKYLWCAPTVPTTLGTGNISVSAIIYKISG